VEMGQSSGYADGFPMARHDVLSSNFAGRWNQLPPSPYYVDGGRTVVSNISGADCVITTSNQLIIVLSSKQLQCLHMVDNHVLMLWNTTFQTLTASCPSYDASSNLVYVALGMSVVGLNVSTGAVVVSRTTNVETSQPPLVLPVGFCGLNTSCVLYLSNVGLQGKVNILDPKLSTPLWSFVSNDSFVSAVVLNDGMILVDIKNVVLFVSSVGVLRWQVNLAVNDASVTSFLSASSVLGVIFVAQSFGRLVALDVMTGATRWMIFLPGLSSAVTVWMTSLFVVSGDGVLRCLYGPTGQQLWQQNGGFVPSSSPIVSSDDIVLVSGASGNLSAIIAFSGRYIWTVNVGNSPINSITPAVFGTVVIVSTNRSNSLTFLRTCNHFDVTISLYSRRNLTYFLSYSTTLPNNAYLVSSSFALSGISIFANSTAVESSHNGTFIQVPPFKNATLQVYLSLQPLPGIRSPLVVFSVPGQLFLDFNFE
jgi:outer membrane protein assembly factor BamB